MLPLAAQHPQSPQLVHVNAATCRNLSLFKELMKEYRKLDDTVTMRMNRTLAQFRDRERLGVSSSRSNPQDEACTYFWQQLVANWTKRTEIIHYCVDAVSKTTEQKQGSEECDRDAGRKSKSTSSSSSSSSPSSYAEEVKRNQIRNELAVEAIVRMRSLDAFKNRCRYFEPASSDAEGRKWWDAAQRGR